MKRTKLFRVIIFVLDCFTSTNLSEKLDENACNKPMGTQSVILSTYRTEKQDADSFFSNFELVMNYL